MQAPDKPETVTDPLGRVTETRYDALDRKTRMTGPVPGDGTARRVSTWRYDLAGQLLEERAAVDTAVDTAEEQAVARYSYFADGQVQGITDPRNYVLGHRYDALGRLVRLDQPDGRSEAYEYDANDNRIALVQRDGTRSVTGYDALNRPVSITRPGLPEVRYGLDISGQLITERQGNTLVRRHVYDTAGRKTAVTATLPRPTNATGPTPSVPVSFTYDAVGNRTSATWSGATVAWRHDTLNRVVAVTLNGQPVTLHRYDGLGRRTETDRGAVANSNTPLLTSRYGYDIASQLTDLRHDWVDGGLTAGYTYTANGELESESISDPSFLWTPAPAQPRSLTYGPADPINALTTVNGIAQAHDGRGNRTRAGTRSFGYDSRNMLTAATLPGMQASYGTWPEGGRAWKQVNGTTTLYLEIDGVEWGEYDQAGTLRRRTIRASGTGGAAIATADSTHRLTWHLPNRQGSVIGWTGADGRLQGRLTYDAYGNSPQGATPGPAFRYAGMRYDPETGLSLTPNRSYDPGDGRWLQLDPIGVKDGLNRYAYVKNGPTNGVDPTGLCASRIQGNEAANCKSFFLEPQGPSESDRRQQVSASGVVQFGNDGGSHKANIGRKNSQKADDRDSERRGLIQFETEPDNHFYANDMFLRNFVGSPEELAVSVTVIMISRSSEEIKPKEYLASDDKRMQLPGRRGDLYGVYSVGPPDNPGPGRIAHREGSPHFYYSPYHYNPSPGVPNTWIRITIRPTKD
jgi:RHS repeat-associated protein